MEYSSGDGDNNNKIIYENMINIANEDQNLNVADQLDLRMRKKRDLNSSASIQNMEYTSEFKSEMYLQV